jgi:peptide/nickel transport system ATP-binding protein
VCFEAPGGSVTAVEGISFELRPGESLALIGESGCGKSTTALSLLRLLPRTAHATGRIELFGEDLLSLPERSLARVRGSKIGMVFHDPFAALNPVLRIGTQIAEALRTHARLTRRGSSSGAIDLLRSVGLPSDTARQYPHQLSGGMRQRALIATALAAAPSFLIADEPTSSLDLVTQRQILELLEQLRRERRIGLLLATHDLDLASALCERVAVLHSGRIVESGSPTEVFSAPRDPYTANLLRDLLPPLGQRVAARSSAIERATSAVVALENVRVDRGRRRVLDGVTLSIAAGEMVGLVGESGSGKSTLARAAAHLIDVDSGQIRWKGRDVLGLTRRALRVARRDVQIVFQDPATSLDPRRTVAECVAEPLEVHRLVPRRLRRERVVELLRLVELGPEVLGRHPHEISGGQAQRVALARALATSPALLIADEALSALDVSLRAQMARLLLDLRASLGIACLFITHDLRLAAHLCDRIAVIAQGRIVRDGTPDEIVQDPLHPAAQALIAAATRKATRPP